MENTEGGGLGRRPIVSFQETEIVRGAVLESRGSGQRGGDGGDGLP